MIQSNFQHVKGPESIGTSGDHLGLVVESFHAAEGNLAFGQKPVEQEFPVSAQHLGHLFHRWETGAHGPGTPVVEELARPGRRVILPEPLKILFEQVGPDRLEVAGEQILQSIHLVVGEVLRPLQQAPAAPGQDRFLSLGPEGPGLLGPDVVDGFIHMSHHMESVENIDRARGSFRDALQVWPPHVTADEPQPLASLRPEPVEESPERLEGPFAADPEQPPSSGIQLIDESGKLLLFLAPADLVSADGRHVVQIAMRKPPLHRHLDRPEDIVPAGLKGSGYLQPGEALGPTGEEPGIGGGQVPLPLCPGNPFDLDPAIRAIDPPHGIQEEHRNPPQGNELETALLLGVVARANLAATGTNGPAALTRPDFHLQGKSARALAPTYRAVHKISMQLHPIQDRLYLHPVFSFLVMDFLVDFHYAKKEDGMPCFQTPSGGNFSFAPHSAALTGTHRFC